MVNVNNILLFGDCLGIPQLLNHIERKKILGIVCASIREEHHDLLQKISREKSIPLIIQPKKDSLHYKDFIEQIQNLCPDLIIVNSYSMFIPIEILNLPKFGAINIHGALLPQYRGANPLQWALINDERETGVTMHYMTELLDQGDIIAQIKVPIYFEDTWLTIRDRIMKATDCMLDDEIPKILNQANSRIPQDEQNARYYHRRKPEDGYIDLKLDPLINIYNKIRALVHPHPGVFLNINGEIKNINSFYSIDEIIDLKYGSNWVLSSSEICLMFCKNDDPDSINPTILANIDQNSQTNNDLEKSQLCKSFKKSNAQRVFKGFSFSIHQTLNQLLIGFCYIYNINWDLRTAEIKINISTSISDSLIYEYQALALLLNFSFSEFNLGNIYVYVLSSNISAIKLYNKVGFVKERTCKPTPLVYGTNSNCDLMRLYSNEWIK